MRDKDKKYIDGHFNGLWREGVSPWSFSSEDLIVRHKKEILSKYLNSSSTILGLGCGGGEFMQFILEQRNKNKFIVGVDIAEKAVVAASSLDIYKELYTSNIDDICNFTKTIEKYDLVLLNEVLYYQKDYIATLEKIIEISTKYIFISLAIGSDYFNEIDTRLIEKLFKRNFYKISYKNKIDYTKFKIPLRLLQFFRNDMQTHKQIYIFERA